jgi:hypothetical protein
MVDASMNEEEDEEEIEEFSDMEALQRVGLVDSRYAPAAGEPDCTTVSEKERGVERGEATRAKKAGCTARMRAEKPKERKRQPVRTSFRWLPERQHPGRPASQQPPE